MNNHMPRTPFSTPLSRSARETKLRLENIASGPKKRPPMPFLALVLSFCLLCGNLVSCQMAEAEVLDIPADASQSENAPVQLEDGWLRAELDTRLMNYAGSDWWNVECYPTQKELALLEDLPARELPREAVDVHDALRQDYWRDTLLPVAYDEGEDVTVYLAFDPDSLPDQEPGAGLPWWAPEEERGIVLRCGDRAVYFHLFWDLKYSGNPLLLVDDFDGDGKPEAAVVLGEGGGTGCCVECLYIIELDTMTETVPDYSEIPLQITYNSEKTLAKLSSGDQEQEVDLTELVADGFQGRVEVGNQVAFFVRDGRMYCCLTPDFYCNTLGYLVSVDFPVVYEDGAYRLGEAVSLTGTLPD